MGNDPFEQELRPCPDTEFRREGRQRLAPETVDQRTAPEGAVDDDRQPALGGEGQEAGFGLAVEHVVGELHGIEGVVALHDLREAGVAATVGSGDADGAYAAFGLHGAQGFDMALIGKEVVDLHQIEARDSP